MPRWEIDPAIKLEFKSWILVYPQPIASSLTRLLASRNLSEWIDNCLKSAEICTRYIAACSAASFSVRSNAEDDEEKLDNFRSSRLDFGTFEHIVIQIANKEIDHRLKTHLAIYNQQFNSVLRDGERETPAVWIKTLRELRNELGHNLSGMSIIRARRILHEEKPIEFLYNILKKYSLLFSLPVFVIEEISVDKKEYPAQLLLLMGESYYPIPKEIRLQNPIENKKHPYLAIDNRVLDLYPFMIWDEIPKREYFGLLFIDSFSKRTVHYKSLDPGKHIINSDTVTNLKNVMSGKPVVKEEIVLSDSRNFVDIWNSELEQKIEEANVLNRQIPWDRCVPETLKWYANRLSPGSVQPSQKIIQKALFPNRESFNKNEIYQIVLLFGNDVDVEQQIHRNNIDIRIRDEKTGRFSERYESQKNIIESLRLAVDIFGKVLGIENASIDILDTKTGTSDYLAMREALVNMFIHQDYNDNRAPAQVDISKNGILFFNMGHALVSNETLFDGGKSQARNPLIASALRIIGFAELGGSGIRVLADSWQKDNRRSPVINSDKNENSFSISLEKSSYDDFWKEKLGVTLTAQEAHLLNLIADPGGVTLEQSISASGFPPDVMYKMIHYLTTQALIELKDERYRVKDHVRQIIEARRT